MNYQSTLKKTKLFKHYKELLKNILVENFGFNIICIELLNDHCDYF